jgi:hypothetical protein
MGYMKDEHPDRLEEKQRLRVLLDSACSSTMILNTIKHKD